MASSLRFLQIMLYNSSTMNKNKMSLRIINSYVKKMHFISQRSESMNNKELYLNIVMKIKLTRHRVNTFKHNRLSRSNLMGYLTKEGR